MAGRSPSALFMRRCALAFSMHLASTTFLRNAEMANPASAGQREERDAICASRAGICGCARDVCRGKHFGAGTAVCLVSAAAAATFADIRGGIATATAATTSSTSTSASAATATGTAGTASPAKKIHGLLRFQQGDAFDRCTGSNCRSSEHRNVAWSRARADHRTYRHGRLGQLQRRTFVAARKYRAGRDDLRRYGWRTDFHSGQRFPSAAGADRTRRARTAKSPRDDRASGLVAARDRGRRCGANPAMEERTRKSEGASGLRWQERSGPRR